MGPGRWGSRGDIKLGVSVTYSDINNTAVLDGDRREDAASYVPDLSFGTHFFQDLVEAVDPLPAALPRRPRTSVFDEAFLQQSPNILAELAPEFADLAAVVRVIDVPATTGGLILRIVMDAAQDRAVGFLSPPAGSPAA